MPFVYRNRLCGGQVDGRVNESDRNAGFWWLRSYIMPDF